MKKVVVIKVGGAILENEESLCRLLDDFAALPGNKVLVHGGGVMASQMQKEMGMVPQMIEGSIVRTVIQSQLTIENIEGEI